MQEPQASNSFNMEFLAHRRQILAQIADKGGDKFRSVFVADIEARSVDEVQAGYRRSDCGDSGEGSGRWFALSNIHSPG